MESIFGKKPAKRGAVFGHENIPVRAKRRERQRRYSDVTVLVPNDAGELVGRFTIEATRPKGSPFKWEPEEVLKK